MRTQLIRFRQVIGLPNVVAVTALLFGQTLLQVLNLAADTIVLQLALLAGLGVVLLLSYRRFLREATGARTIGQPGTTKLGHRRGAIVLIGLDSDRPGSDVAKLLRAAGGLEYLALLGTPQTASRGVADRIGGQLLAALSHPLPGNAVRSWEQSNAESISDFEQATREAITWMLRRGLSPEDIVVDISDGRRPMGYGALTAASALRVETQYLAAVWNHVANAPLRDQEAFKVVQSFYTEDAHEDAHRPSPSPAPALMPTPEVTSWRAPAT